MIFDYTHQTCYVWVSKIIKFTLYELWKLFVLAPYCVVIKAWNNYKIYFVKLGNSNRRTWDNLKLYVISDLSTIFYTYWWFLKRFHIFTAFYLQFTIRVWVKIHTIYINILVENIYKCLQIKFLNIIYHVLQYSYDFHLIVLSWQFSRYLFYEKMVYKP